MKGSSLRGKLNATRAEAGKNSAQCRKIIIFCNTGQSSLNDAASKDQISTLVSTTRKSKRT